MKHITSSLSGANVDICARASVCVWTAMHISHPQVHARLRESEGIARLAAAENGSVDFVDVGDGSGRVAVRWRGGADGARNRRGSSGEDVVQLIPPALLPFLLGALAKDADGDVQSYITSPYRMASASPRVFWSIVRGYNVGVGAREGNGRSFAQAIAACLPDRVREDEVGRRERMMPERYAGYVPSDTIPSLRELQRSPGGGRGGKAKKGKGKSVAKAGGESTDEREHE